MALACSDLVPGGPGGPSPWPRQLLLQLELLVLLAHILLPLPQPYPAQPRLSFRGWLKNGMFFRGFKGLSKKIYFQGLFYGF